MSPFSDVKLPFRSFLGFLDKGVEYYSYFIDYIVIYLYEQMKEKTL